MPQRYDLIVVGAGTAGIPAAITAAEGGARVLLLEQSDRPGGMLHVSAAQMSGADTALQRARGIADDPAAHYQDALRISRNTCDAALVGKAVALCGPTIDWLMSLGFDMDPACPAILHFHEAYRIPRTYWGRDGGRSVLRVLLPLLDQALARPNLTLRLRTEVVGLLAVGPQGGVAGVRLRDAGTGETEEVRAGRVVLATGGYGGNPAMFARLNGLPLYTAALPIATGRGIELAEAIGARVRGADLLLPTFAGIEEEPGSGRVVWHHLPSLTPQTRPPWEVFVAPDGRRFVQEDVESVDARERALLNEPGLTFWAVFDETVWRNAPPMLPGWTQDELAAAWDRHPSFCTAPTLRELARRAGIDAAGLTATIADYNAGQACGADAWGRRHLPCPIEVPPFRAVRMHGIILKTPAGLAVDEALRVLDGAGEPIPGLYAIGEAIGGATLSGNAFVGGMSVTPALAFGRWLGGELARQCAGGAA